MDGILLLDNEVYSFREETILFIQTHRRTRTTDSHTNKHINLHRPEKMKMFVQRNIGSLTRAGKPIVAVPTMENRE